MAPRRTVTYSPYVTVGRYHTACMSNRADRSERTHAALLRAARDLFSARGFAAVSTEEIVAAAAVTRGALYHHFRDKRDLFRAVHEQIEAELVAELDAVMTAAPDAAAKLEVGLRAFLDFCSDPSRSRVALLEAPTVLGWAQWREIDERLALGLIRQALTHAMEAGVLVRHPVDPLAQVLNGALNEAALVIANAPDPRAARAEVESALHLLIEGLRA